MVVRWGVMLVGPTGGGKTSVLHTLARALTKLADDGVNGPYYRQVRIQVTFFVFDKFIKKTH